MVNPSTIRGAVPAAYEPGWRELPRLGWVGARAYVPPGIPRRLAPALGACSMLIWLPSVVHMRAAHRLARRARTALMAIEPVGRRKLRELAWPVIAAAVALFGVMIVLLVAGLGVAEAALRAGAGPGTATLVASAVIAAPAVVAGVLISPWRVLRSQPRVSRTVRALRAQDPESGIWRLGALAAWPQGHGHGGALVEGLLRDWEAGGYAIGNPRNPAVAEWYLRLGMREYPPGGVLVLDLRSGSGSTDSGEELAADGELSPPV